MNERIRYTTAGTLPDALPIFPLPGALLLPGGHLPLNIFEPRYLNMIEDALGQGRVIGMIQPFAENDERQIADGTKLYDIGCVGRIVQFSESGDGRYLITLEGVARFQRVEELPLKDGYRRVRADVSGYLRDFEATGVPASLPDRDGLITAMTRYFHSNGISADLEQIAEASDDVLVNTLAMSCPLAPGEKQALLECENTLERGALLISIFEIAAHAPANDVPTIRQ